MHTFSNRSTHLNVRSAEEKLPPLEEYEAFCTDYVLKHPRTPKNYILRDPKRLRSLVLARRGALDPHIIASRFGMKLNTMGLILRKVPDNLK